MIWVRNRSNLAVVATKVRVLEGLGEKFLGVMGLKEVEPSLFVLDKPAKGLRLHSWFCSDLIDVIGLNEKKKVVYLCAGWKPWTSLTIDCEIKWVLELQKGTITSTRTRIGDSLQFCQSKK